MRGTAVMYSIPAGMSRTRQRFLTPFAFMLGVTARQIVLALRSGSATTRSVANGSSPRSVHSTLA